MLAVEYVQILVEWL